MQTSSHADQEELMIVLAAIDADYPRWHAWEGVIAGLLYARCPGSTPPLVVRSTSPDGLRQEIETAERERGLRQ